MSLEFQSPNTIKVIFHSHHSPMCVGLEVWVRRGSDGCSMQPCRGLAPSILWLCFLCVVLGALFIQPVRKEERVPLIGVFYGPDLEMAYITSVLISLDKTQLWLHLTARWARLCSLAICPWEKEKWFGE